MQVVRAASVANMGLDAAARRVKEPQVCTNPNLLLQQTRADVMVTALCHNTPSHVPPNIVLFSNDAYGTEGDGLA